MDPRIGAMKGTPPSRRRLLRASLAVGTMLTMPLARAQGAALVPQIDGAWWKVAGDPDLGKLTSERQQPVDFTVWPARDGSWLP